MISLKKKIVSQKKAVTAINRLKKSGKTTVFTNGCFDIIHPGHIKILEASKKFGDFLIIGLNSDKSVKRIKGKNRPINKQNDRAVVLSALSPVDMVVVFDEDTPKRILSILRPDVLVKGADYKTDEIIGREYVKRTKRVSLLKGKSTTKIIKRLK
jgi:rfaE bifunctional protein nucleotidyltransferase chain/domain